MKQLYKKKTLNYTVIDFIITIHYIWEGNPEHSSVRLPDGRETVSTKHLAPVENTLEESLQINKTLETLTKITLEANSPLIIKFRCSLKLPLELRLPNQLRLSI